MLQASERPRTVASRIRGVNALRRRLQLALIAAHRYGSYRASTPEQQAYAAALMSGLTELIAIQPPAEWNYPTRPVRKRKLQGDLG